MDYTVDHNNKFKFNFPIKIASLAINKDLLACCYNFYLLYFFLQNIKSKCLMLNIKKFFLMFRTITCICLSILFIERNTTTITWSLSGLKVTNKQFKLNNIANFLSYQPNWRNRILWTRQEINKANRNTIFGGKTFIYISLC